MASPRRPRSGSTPACRRCGAGTYQRSPPCATSAAAVRSPARRSLAPRSMSPICSRISTPRAAAGPSPCRRAHRARRRLAPLQGDLVGEPVSRVAGSAGRAVVGAAAGVDQGPRGSFCAAGRRRRRCSAPPCHRGSAPSAAADARAVSSSPPRAATPLQSASGSVVGLLLGPSSAWRGPCSRRSAARCLRAARCRARARRSRCPHGGHGHGDARCGASTSAPLGVRPAISCRGPVGRLVGEGLLELVSEVRWSTDPGTVRFVTTSHHQELAACPSPPPRSTPRCWTPRRPKSFAFPAINVSSSQTLNAALQGFAEAGSDGIIQVSTGGAEYLSGPSVKDMVTGSVAFAAYAAEVAKNYPVNIALHTDHCPKDKLDGFVRPLLAISAERVARGEAPLFQSHMWDGSAVPLEENLQIAQELLAQARRGQDHPRGRGRRRRRRGGRRRHRDQRPALHDPRGRAGHGRGARPRREGPLHVRADLRQRARRLQARQREAPPRDPAEAQDAVAKELGLAADARPFDLVFHGGSGSTAEEIGAAVDYGVIKMNVDTDTQYAFTRPVAGPHPQELRRRPQGRRRGRQQEGSTTRAPGARPARRAWPRASSRPARTCARPAPRWASEQLPQAIAIAKTCSAPLPGRTTNSTVLPEVSGTELANIR